MRHVIRLGLASILLLTGAVAIEGDASATAPHNVFPVSGTSLLDGVACTSALDCVGVGQAGTQQTGVVVVEGKTVGTAQPIANTNQLYGVACPTPTSCLAVGVGNQASDGMIVPVHDGTAGSAQSVSQTAYLHGIACSSSTSCVAVGWEVGPYNGANAKIGVVVPIVGGAPGGVELISGTLYLYGVSCSSASCMAVGGDPSGHGAIVPISSTGTAGGASSVSGAGPLQAVSCPTAANCAAVGSTSAGDGVVIPIKDGSAGAVNSVPGGGTVWGISCPTVSVCTAVGSGGDAGVAGGYVDVGGGAGAGYPSVMRAVTGTSRLYAASCPDTASCVAAGQTPPLGSGQGAFAAFGQAAGPWQLRDKKAAASDMPGAVGNAVTFCTPYLLGLTGFTVGTLMIGSAGILAMAGEITAFAAEPFCIATMKRVLSDYGRIHDPPDSRFGQLAIVAAIQPLRAPSCKKWSGAVAAFCVQLSAAAGRWAQSAELVASVDQTLLTTQDRESAANAAGDQSAAKLQDGLIPKLEQRERTALASMASAGRAFGDLLQTHGIGYRMNVAQSRAIINAVEKKLADQHITASELKQLAPSELTPRPIDILRVLLEG